MHPLDRHLMDRRLDLREALKERLRAIATGWRKRRPIDQREDLGQTPMWMLVLVVMVVGVAVVMTVMMIVLVHDELGGRHAGAQDTRRADVEAGHGEAAERALQLVERQAGVEQGAERHVARDAREAIEIQQSRHTGWL